VDYNSWTVDQLLAAIDECASGRKFTTIGLFDHGGPGEFCLLRSFAGGSIDLADFHGEDCEAVEEFFKELTSYLMRPPPHGEDASKSKIYRVDVLACSVAAGENGLALVEHLRKITSTNFAASVSQTGASADGEFDYELQTEEGLCVAQDYFDVPLIMRWEHFATVPRAEGLSLLDKRRLSKAGREGISKHRPHRKERHTSIIGHLLDTAFDQRPDCAQELISNGAWEGPWIPTLAASHAMPQIPDQAPISMEDLRGSLDESPEATRHHTEADSTWSTILESEYDTGAEDSMEVNSMEVNLQPTSVQLPCVEAEKVEMSSPANPVLLHLIHQDHPALLERASSDGLENVRRAVNGLSAADLFALLANDSTHLTSHLTAPVRGADASTSTTGTALHSVSSTGSRLADSSHAQFPVVKNGAEQGNAHEKPRDVVRKDWTPAEDAIIREAVQEHGYRWRIIAQRLPGRTDDAVRNRWTRMQEAKPLVSFAVTNALDSNTEGAAAPNLWQAGSEPTGTVQRAGCAAARPVWTQDEDKYIMEAYAELGSKWSVMAERMPNRTEHAIRNRYYRLRAKTCEGDNISNTR